MNKPPKNEQQLQYVIARLLFSMRRSLAILAMRRSLASAVVNSNFKLVCFFDERLPCAHFLLGRRSVADVCMICSVLFYSI